MFFILFSHLLVNIRALTVTRCLLFCSAIALCHSISAAAAAAAAIRVHEWVLGVCVYLCIKCILGKRFVFCAREPFYEIDENVNHPRHHFNTTNVFVASVPSSLSLFLSSLPFLHIRMWIESQMRWMKFMYFSVSFAFSFPLTFSFHHSLSL